MNCRWIWILALLVWSSAALSDEIDDCNTSSDYARVIKGCTSLISGGNLNRRNAIRAFKKRASAYSETGNFDSAISDYTMALEFDPKAELTYAFRGEMYGKKADFEAAIRDLTKSLELKANSIAYVDRARIYEKMGDHARAITDYTKAIEFDAGSPSSSLYTSRAEAFMASGDYESAVGDCTKAIEADAADVELTNRNSTTADLFICRARALLGAGRFSEALHDSEYSLTLWPGVPAALTTRGRVLEALGRRDEAIADFQRALTNAPDYDEAKTVLAKLGVAARLPDEMQVLLKHVIDLDHDYKRDEAILAGKDYARAVERQKGTAGPEYAFALDLLFDLYAANDQLDEAEQAARQALAIRESAAVVDRLEIAKNLTNLAAILDRAQKYNEAEPNARKALEIREQALKPDHPRIAESLNNVAVLLFRQGQLAQSEALECRALQIIERDPDALGKPGERLLSVLNSLAAILEGEHRRADADAINRRALGVAEPLEERQQKQIADGTPPPSVEASMLGKNSYLFGGGRNWAQLLVSARGYVHDRRDQASDRDHIALPQNDSVFSPALRARVQALFRMGANESNNLAEGFLIAQRMLLNDAARAISKLATRFGTGNGALANLIREQQDRLDRRTDAFKLLHENYELGQISRIDEPEDALRQVIAEQDKALDETETKLKEQFPEFIALAHPEPLAISDVQAQLREGEALVMFKDFEAWANIIPEETFIWVVTKTDSRWVRSALGTKALTQNVASLRCGLDDANWVDASRWPTVTEDDKAARSAQIAQREQCKQLTGKDTSQWLPFDLVKAHELYSALFDEISDLVKDKQLLLVPSGPLTRLPFQVLVTEKPAAAIPTRAEEYAKASWLIREHSITVLPSVSSLKALRRDARPSTATIPFIGFGNPLLLGSANNDKRAFAKQACPKKPQASPIKVAGLAVPQRHVSLIRGGLGDVTVLREQPPLPETADELCTIASEIGGSDRDIHLGAEATESEVKTLSADGTLANARVVQFATHGLLANETSRVANALDEPALLLTPPATPTKDDDGLLTVSEVSQLKLDADWVILSACNTAGGGDDKNSEALSGLARAFFYSGARALLVSHWYVDSRASVQLTTRTFAELEKSPEIGRAEALRRAMLAAMQDVSRPKSWMPAAHPAVWAPFVLVGEGGASQAISDSAAATNVQASPAVAGDTGSIGSQDGRPATKTVRKRPKQPGTWDWLGNF